MKTIFFFGLLLLSGIAGHAQTARISVAELPLAARSFLNQHYKYRPIEFVRKKEHASAPYEVRLAQGTQICFAENGEWCEVDGAGSSLPSALVPENITDYLKANYPKKRIVYIEKDANHFDVSLNGKIGLEFDAKGNPIR